MKKFIVAVAIDSSECQAGFVVLTKKEFKRSEMDMLDLSLLLWDEDAAVKCKSFHTWDEVSAYVSSKEGDIIDVCAAHYCEDETRDLYAPTRYYPDQNRFVVLACIDSNEDQAGFRIMEEHEFFQSMQQECLKIGHTHPIEEICIINDDDFYKIRFQTWKDVKTYIENKGGVIANLFGVNI